MNGINKELIALVAQTEDLNGEEFFPRLGELCVVYGQEEVWNALEYIAHPCPTLF